MQRQLACRNGGTYLAGMWNPFRRSFAPPTPTSAVTREELDELRRAFASLSLDMTGLADKMSRQLKRIRQRAYNAQAEEEDPEDGGIPPEWRR